MQVLYLKPYQFPSVFSDRDNPNSFPDNPNNHQLLSPPVYNIIMILRTVMMSSVAYREREGQREGGRSRGGRKGELKGGKQQSREREAGGERE